ncbi:hypothetical protein [Streptomyces sp. NPDC127084]|uniref:hypothetical protein n=1 Tax=Streptomyces sp. NPDC127084 TaxID=3347133 RepID=UPI00366205ED
MNPRPDKETRAAAKERIAELKRVRDEAHAAADQAKEAADEVMWQAIAAELDQGQALQLDAVDATGFSRDHVLRRTKKYRTNQN